MNLWSVTLATLAKDIRPQVAFRRAQLHAVSLLVVVIFGFRFDPAGESRHIAGEGSLGGDFVAALAVCAEPDLSPRVAQIVLDAACPLRPMRCFWRKRLAILFFVGLLEALMAPLFIVLISRAVGQRMAVDSRLHAARNLGAGGERHVLCGHVDPHPQPPNYVCPLLLFPVSIQR